MRLYKSEKTPLNRIPMSQNNIMHKIVVMTLYNEQQTENFAMEKLARFGAVLLPFCVMLACSDVCKKHIQLNLNY
jgi:hypothetical protein